MHGIDAQLVMDDCLIPSDYYKPYCDFVINNLLKTMGATVHDTHMEYSEQLLCFVCVQVLP
jgi:hypothetical protein